MKNVIKTLGSDPVPPEQNRTWAMWPSSPWRLGKRTDYTCTQGRLTSHHSDTQEKKQEKTLFTQEREKDKDIIQRETWSEAELLQGGEQDPKPCKTSGNGTDSQGSRAVPVWVLVQHEMLDRQKRTGGGRGKEQEKIERYTPRMLMCLWDKHIEG